MDPNMIMLHFCFHILNSPVSQPTLDLERRPEEGPMLRRLVTGSKLSQITPKNNALSTIPPAYDILPAISYIVQHHFSTNAAQYDHWIDRFSGLRDWLEGANRRWWIKGLVEARCKQHHQLEGRELMLRSALESEYDRLYNRHSDMIVDTRAKTHLSVACLALATHKTLLSFLRDEEAVMEIIRDHMGAHTTPALVFTMKMVAWLQRDSYTSLVNRLRALKIDYGKGFTTEIKQGPEHSSLRISSCFYRNIFELEEVPQLTSACCCSQDRVWLEGLISYGNKEVD
ncbi:hypothetical protein Ndes2437B_g09181 [Nannochloris sp. 'desiccata']